MSDIDSYLDRINENPNDPEANENLMRYYFENNMPIAAKEIADKFPDSVPMMLMLIDMYYGDRNMDGIAEIAERFPDNIEIQSKAIGAYISTGKMEKVREILERFPEYNKDLHFKTCIKLKDKGQYSAVKKIGKMFPDVPEIQGQIMGIFIEELKYAEALEIGQRDIFANEPSVQSRMMRIYRIKRNNEDADSLAQRMADSPEVQFEYMKILQARKEFDKIGLIALKFPEDQKIQRLHKQMKNIRKAARRAVKGEKSDNKEEIISEEEKILREIYGKNINEDLLKRINDIDNPAIRNILTAARYDRTSAQTNLRKQFIRDLKSSSEYSDYKKIYNILIQKLNEKSKIFNFESYSSLLFAARDIEDEIIIRDEEAKIKLEFESSTIYAQAAEPAVKPETEQQEAVVDEQVNISAQDMLKRITDGLVSEEEAKNISINYPGLSGTVLIAAYFKKNGNEVEIARAKSILSNYLSQEKDKSRCTLFRGTMRALELELPIFPDKSFTKLLEKAIEIDEMLEITESENKVAEENKVKTPKEILDGITDGSITTEDVLGHKEEFPILVQVVLVAASIRKGGDKNQIEETVNKFRDALKNDENKERQNIYRRVLGALTKSKEFPSNAFNSILDGAIQIGEKYNTEPQDPHDDR